MEATDLKSHAQRGSLAESMLNPSHLTRKYQTMEDKKLTKKQALFIEHYKECFCATKAARRAGYSDRSAANIGYENMKRPHIKKVIDAFLEERHKAWRAEMNAHHARRSRDGR